MKLGTKINIVLVAVIAIVLTAAFWVIVNFEAKSLKQQVLDDAETVSDILLVDIERMFEQLRSREKDLQSSIDTISMTAGVTYVDVSDVENKYIAATDRSQIGKKISASELVVITKVKEARTEVNIRKDKGTYYEVESYVPVLFDPEDPKSRIINVIKINVVTRSKDDNDTRYAGKLLQIVGASIEQGTRAVSLTYNDALASLEKITRSVVQFNFFHDFVVYNGNFEVIMHTKALNNETSANAAENHKLRKDVLEGVYPFVETERVHHGESTIMRLTPITTIDQKTGVKRNVGLVEIHILKKSYESRVQELKVRMLGVGIAFTIILVVVLAFILERLVGGPIRRYSVVAQKIANGDLNQKVEHTSNDEIGQFGDVFNSMVENLRVFDKLKSDFISVAAHQLRTPLSGVKWVLKLLLDGDLGELEETQKGMVKRGYDTNEKMIQLVNDLLNVSRIENDKFGYKFETNDFKILLKTLMENVELPSKERNINVELINKLENMEPCIFDPEKLLIALQNIVDNAMKYTLPGGKVIIEVSRQGDYIQVKITDTGVGIPKADITKLYSKFFRAANVIHLQTDGSGLGLFIVKSIIIRHGGQIWVDSVEGKGTTFTVVVPIIADLLPKREEGEDTTGLGGGVSVRTP